MALPHWSSDDARIVGDVALAGLLAPVFRLVLVKAFFEPAAIWLGQMRWRKADELTGDRLPDWFK